MSPGMIAHTLVWMGMILGSIGVFELVGLGWSLVAAGVMVIAYAVRLIDVDTAAPDGGR